MFSAVSTTKLWHYTDIYLFAEATLGQTFTGKPSISPIRNLSRRATKIPGGVAASSVWAPSLSADGTFLRYWYWDLLSHLGYILNFYLSIEWSIITIVNTILENIYYNFIPVHIHISSWFSLRQSPYDSAHKRNYSLLWQENHDRWWNFMHLTNYARWLYRLQIRIMFIYRTLFSCQK